MFTEIYFCKPQSSVLQWFDFLGEQWFLIWLDHEGSRRMEATGSAYAHVTDLRITIESQVNTYNHRISNQSDPSHYHIPPACLLTLYLASSTTHTHTQLHIQECCKGIDKGNKRKMNIYEKLFNNQFRNNQYYQESCSRHTGWTWSACTINCIRIQHSDILRGEREKNETWYHISK